MKVLMFGWEFPPHNSGGLGVACKGIVESLCSQGTSVSFVLPKKVPLDPSPHRILFADDETTAELTVHGVDVLLTPYVTSEQYREHTERVKKGDTVGSSYARSLMEEVYRYGALARDVAHAEEHDVIHAHDWLSFEAGIAAKRASKKPLVVHVHATEFDRSGENINRAVYDIERRGVHVADRVVAVSRFTKDILTKRYGVTPDKISVVHNGINEEEYNDLPTEAPESIKRLKKHGYKIVLFVGRITFQKGPDYFVRMAKKVRAHEPNTFFVVSGSGDMERQMMEEVAAARMSDRFIFTGFLRGDPLNTVYKAADLYIMPSVSEPFGITPLEAMMHDTPVLISKQAGVSEVVKHALKADFWDTDDMASKTVSLLRGPSLKQCLRSNGRRELSGINWKVAGEKLVTLYRQLASK